MYITHVYVLVWKTVQCQNGAYVYSKLVRMEEEEKLLISKSGFSATGLVNNLLHDSDFSDVTLVCEDNQHISAHRSVLSCSSPFLRQLLYSSQQQSTYLYLGQAHTEEVVALLQFIYLGSCAVQKSRLGSLKTLAAGLGVEGFQDRTLADSDFGNETIQKKIDTTETKTETEIINYDKYSDHIELTQTSPFEQTSDDLSSKEKWGVPEQTLMKENIAIKVEESATKQKNMEKKKRKTQKYDWPYVELPLPDESGRFCCNECGKTFKSKYRLRDHKLSYHEGFTFDCDQCPKQFKGTDSLDIHRNFFHGGLNLSCSVCGLIFTSLQRLNVHNQQIPCNVCIFISCSSKSLTKHCNTIHNPKFFDGLYHCDECDYTSTKNRHLYQHKYSTHRDNIFTCEQCNHQVKSNESLKNHLKTKHLHMYSFCELCDFKTTLHKKLKYHMQWIHEGIGYSCTMCEYKGKSRAVLKRHTIIKHDLKKQHCKQCSFECAFDSSLRRHVRTKHEGKIFQCPKCNFTATQNNPVLNHIKRVHDGLTWDCSICSKPFSAPDYLRHHLKKTHNEQQGTTTTAVKYEEKNPTVLTK